MTDAEPRPTPNGPPVTSPPSLTETGRHLIEAVLRQELADAGARLLAAGVSPEAITRYLTERTARLRSTLSSADQHVVDDVANDPGDAGKLGGIAD